MDLNINPAKPKMTVLDVRETYDTVEDWKKRWIDGYKAEEEKKRLATRLTLRQAILWAVLVLSLSPIVGAIVLKILQ